MQALITAIQGLGPLGPVIFFVAVVICEMIPLFPTQPLSLAAGLLFDVSLGSALIWAGNIGAATAAFTLARGAGRRFAQQMVRGGFGALLVLGPSEDEPATSFSLLTHHHLFCRIICPILAR